MRIVRLDGSPAAVDVLTAALAAVLDGPSDGNGGALVCNVLLVQSGAPDRLRGREFTLIISSNYALMGAGMALSGPFTNAFGARWTWGAAAAVFALGSAVAYSMAAGLADEAAELVLDQPESEPVVSQRAVAN